MTICGWFFWIKNTSANGILCCLQMCFYHTMSAIQDGPIAERDRGVEAGVWLVGCKEDLFGLFAQIEKPLFSKTIEGALSIVDKEERLFRGAIGEPLPFAPAESQSDRAGLPKARHRPNRLICQRPGEVVTVGT